MKYQSTVYQICLVLTLSAVVTLWVVYTVSERVKNMKVQYYELGTTVAQWLRCCATSRKVAGSIPDGVIGIFH
jgi:hypothetical protein